MVKLSYFVSENLNIAINNTYYHGKWEKKGGKTGKSDFR